ncbi:MAG: hypothetical protein ABI609_14280 [Acidobacteriota bacterium]
MERRLVAEEILQAGQRAWFYRLLRNAVVDHYRSRGAGAICRCFEAMLRFGRSPWKSRAA